MRYLAWRILESVKQDSIYDRKKDIKKCIENDEYYKANITKKVKDILEYAVVNVPFYKEYNSDNLNNFPVVNKKIIMDNYDSMISDEYKNQAVHEMSTSGSTGIPFKVVQDLGKRRQVLAEILFYNSLVGYEVGKRFVYLRNLESGLNKSKIKCFMQNEKIIFTQKYDDENLKNIVYQIKNMEKDTTIICYASTLQMISNYMNDNNIKIGNVTGIISGAEALPSKVRNIATKVFNCPVVSCYSNQEMGIYAQDFEEDKFLLNRASYYFELLDMDSDEPVKDGNVGRIVVTDLYNKALPMLRYDTGDLGVMEVINGKQYLTKVMGRKLDLLYTTKDEPVTFFVFDEYFEPNYDIEQYQIVQEDRTHITINLIMKLGRTVDKEYCIESIKKIMGQDCIVEIKYLNEVPITASGKFRYVICNYKPTKV